MFHQHTKLVVNPSGRIVRLPLAAAADAVKRRDYRYATPTEAERYERSVKGGSRASSRRPVQVDQAPAPASAPVPPAVPSEAPQVPAPVAAQQAAEEAGEGDGGAVDLATMTEDQIADLAAVYDMDLRDDSGQVITKEALANYAAAFDISLNLRDTKQAMMAAFIGARFDQIRAEQEGE